MASEVQAEMAEEGRQTVTGIDVSAGKDKKEPVAAKTPIKKTPATESKPAEPLKFTATYERWILDKGIKVGLSAEFYRKEIEFDEALKFLEAKVEAEVTEVTHQAPEQKPAPTTATSHSTAQHSTVQRISYALPEKFIDRVLVRYIDGPDKPPSVTIKERLELPEFKELAAWCEERGLTEYDQVARTWYSNVR